MDCKGFAFAGGRGGKAPSPSFLPTQRYVRRNKTGSRLMTPDILAALDQARKAKRPVVLATRLPTGEQRLLPDPSAPAGLNEAAASALDRDESGTVKLDGTDWFLHAYNPPLRLIVVGAVHIAQALVPFALPCGFSVTVVDPRRSFASDERF